jgi:hypothetical protein
MMSPHKDQARHGQKRSHFKPSSNPNATMESLGPTGKNRGTKQQLIEKYTALAQDALREDDGVLCEAFLQHAEHYRRLLNVMKKQEALAEPAAVVSLVDEKPNIEDTSIVVAAPPVKRTRKAPNQASERTEAQPGTKHGPRQQKDLDQSLVIVSPQQA